MTVQPVTITFEGRPPAEFLLELGETSEQDIAIHWYLDRQLLPEPEMIHVMARAIRPGDFVVDCGACTGFFSLVMGALGARVLAIEPGTNNLPALRANIALNPFPIDLRTVALGAQPGIRDFLLINDGGANSFTQPADRPPGDVVQVDVYPLSDLPDENPRLIKLDIEGAEFEVLKEWLCGPWTCPYIVAEYNVEALRRAGHTGDELRRLMADWGYEMFMLFADGVLPLWMPEGVEVQCSRQNTNVLFCKPADICALWPELKV